MKKSIKRLLGILLTASIAAATVFPMQSTKASEINREISNVAQKEEENTVSANVPANIAAENAAMPSADSYDIDQPVIESFEFLENGQALTQNDTLHFNMSVYDADSGIKSITVMLSGGTPYCSAHLYFQHVSGNLYTATFPCSDLPSDRGDFYVSQIRIEDNATNFVEGEIYSWPEWNYLYSFMLINEDERDISASNFQIHKNASHEDGNLRVGDSVTYTVQIDSQGIPIQEGSKMQLHTTDSKYFDEVTMDYDAQTQTLIGTHTITDRTLPGEWDMTSIYVNAPYMYTHFFYPYKIEPDNNLKFTVVNEDYDYEKPIIESITLDQNGQMLKTGDKITMKVKVKEKNPSSFMYVYFTPENIEASGFSVELRLNETTMEYTGEAEITKDAYPGTWYLISLTLSDRNGNSASLSDFREDWDTARPCYFTVDPKGYDGDIERPIIESVTLDKNGQWVQPGDTVTMTVKVKEKNPSPKTYAIFHPQVSYVSSSLEVELNYRADIKAYVGTIPITEDTYPCEWMLTQFSVSDTYGHHSYLSDFFPDWLSTFPWYYKVKSGNTYREDVKNATFSFYGLAPQADGSFQYDSFISSQSAKNVGRRCSLKELGISFPQPMEGVNAKWRSNWHGTEVNEDTVMLFSTSSDFSCDFYATYDKGCANVALTYMTKDDGIKTVTIPLFTDKEATYQKILDSLTLPEDARTEDFLGYRLEDGSNGDMQVGDISYLSVTAQYDSCQVAWHTRFLDWNGNESYNTIPKSYLSGTTLNEALADLESPGSGGGLEFEGWVLTVPTEDDILSEAMTELEVVAVYRGKTTVDASYTYRREDGRLVSGHRLMAMNGENLTDAELRRQASDAFQEIKHLDGLSLSEWEGFTGITFGRYREADFWALYSNCVAILKFPDGSCQYIVMDKGSPFTLPTENEKYTDILWEGFGEGETVTLTGDREFLVADATPRDGSTPATPDKKPPEEEINQVIEEIRHSDAGATIHVDMRKATVIPKEVLEAIQGKEINIVLHMKGYSWSIGGTNVLADNLKDTDLEVKIDTDTIPGSLVDSIAGGKPATQLSLTHNGPFGFRADLTLNLGSEYHGRTGNLYYYDSSGKLVFRNAGVIGTDGQISLSFSHASDYVVIIDADPSGNGSQDNTQNNSQSGSQNNNQDNSQNNGKETNPVERNESNGIPNSRGSKGGKPKSPKTGEY